MSDPRSIVVTMKECPNHEGSFDCNPFCNLCEGEQEYDPNETLPCQACNNVQINKDIYVEELGFCVDCSHAYFNQELDIVTLERIKND
jgi:hypothetical protein